MMWWRAFIQTRPSPQCSFSLAGVQSTNLFRSTPIIDALTQPVLLESVLDLLGQIAALPAFKAFKNRTLASCLQKRPPSHL